MDFYAVGLLIMGIGSTVSAVNLTVTVLNMRTPGMTLMRMPVFTWMTFVVQVLLVFALPVITVALFLLMFDRLFDATFFDASKGGDPFLWEHLFWIDRAGPRRRWRPAGGRWGWRGSLRRERGRRGRRE